MMRDDEGIVPYGDIGEFHAFLSYSGTGGFHIFPATALQAVFTFSHATVTAAQAKFP